MAVYTEVTDGDLDRFLEQYDVGRALSCKGIAEGVENSNFLVTTDTGPLILTLYEKRVARGDLPFFLGLMDHLASRDIPCPTPIRGRDGESLRELAGRPAALIAFLPGMWPRRITAHHCDRLGTALAHLHDAGRDFAMTRRNTLGLADWRPLFAQCADHADRVHPGLAEELDTALRDLEARFPDTLPTGVIHADLFPDNVFFLRDEISGLIDFYFACTDFLTYDLAVCVNAWCFESRGEFNLTKARRLMSGYRAARDLSPAEMAALPVLAQGAAIRFLLTRLYDWVNTPEGALVRPKDPLEYLHKLRFHRSVEDPRAYGLE
ncbi:homoserine kinase [Roseospira marina]|uniref:Homoserine kinase n=1 Tax=Roseospira marina TaxID=140057 RepID=A0A5M6IJ14_9PROT|nr:homoserine kinase [Roseospira marina]KAA5607705.1 homoserine kinase [Roseospira marina]MBB4312138.1 homoserine kinase type II [Roseospira marina]MBB5085846.1 homoserine kinase type II [Roseospira marina]